MNKGNSILGRSAALLRLAPLSGLLLAIPLVQADASYQETVQVTGGSLIEALKNIPFMPKSMKRILERKCGPHPSHPR